MVLEVVEAPLESPPRTAGLMTGGIVLVTDDGRGIARAFAADLRARGYRVIRVDARRGARGRGRVGRYLRLGRSHVAGGGGHPARPGPRARPAGGPGACAAAPRDAPGGARPGRLDGADGPRAARAVPAGPGGGRRTLPRGQGGGACLVAATGLGGAFASAGTAPDDFFPGHGGIAGLVKTLAKEWPDVRARVVDLDPTGDVEMLASHLVQEFLAADSRIEVGYLERRRVALRPIEAPLPQDAEPAWAVSLAPEEPIIVTGGARGSPRRSRPTWPGAGGRPCSWWGPARCRPIRRTRRPAGSTRPSSSRRSSTRTSAGRVVRSVRPTSSGPTSRCGASARSATTSSASARPAPWWPTPRPTSATLRRCAGCSTTGNAGSGRWPA